MCLVLLYALFVNYKDELFVHLPGSNRIIHFAVHNLLDVTILS